MELKVWLLAEEFHNVLLYRLSPLKPTELRYDWIFFPNSRALLPTFRTDCPDGSHFAQMGPRIPKPTPVLYSAVIHPFRGYVRTQNTPKPTPKHPFSWPELESGQNELPSILTPTGQNVWKVGKTFLEVGKFIHSSVEANGAIRAPPPEPGWILWNQPAGTARAW